MKRRTFLASVSAIAAVPAAPVAAPAAITQHLAKATMLARCHDRASPEMFTRLMKLDGETAKGVFNLLKDKRIIGHGADGVARAITPLNTHCIPNEATRARDLAKMTSDIVKRVRRSAKQRMEHADVPQPEMPTTANPDTSGDTPDTDTCPPHANSH